jgi:mono/diheme cytochrome c family protein
MQFPDTGRRQIRQVFPSDYLWAFNRVDDLSQVIRSEVDHFDFVDRDGVPARAGRVLMLIGDPTSGQTIFADRCTRCHGVEGLGSVSAPNLFERVPMRDDLSIAVTIIGGRDPMPAWGETLDDQQLADVVRFLRNNFDAPTTSTPEAAGDLVLTEIMANPEAVDDTVGEWIELYNPTDSSLELTGCTLSDDSSSSMLDGVSVPAGGYVTFARSSDAGFMPNGLITNALDNAGDVLTITCGGTVIDVVDYTSFPRAFGASLSLDPSSQSHTANDEGVNWCWATSELGTGDLGTPGAPNPACP